MKQSGTGSLAIAVHGDPMVSVTPGNDLNTDPHATVVWSDGLVPTLATDLSWKTGLAMAEAKLFKMHFTERTPSF